MNLEIQQNVSLADFTTFKIGGKARYFATAESERGILEAIEFAEANNLQIFILGGGSNILIADAGFDGLVLQIGIKGISSSRETDERVYLTVGAGENWDLLCAFGVEKNLAGFECLSGIPGNVGGTPVQNVGAYGQEISETIVSVRCYDRDTRDFTDLTNAQCHFAYRASVFNTAKKNRYIVLAVTFALEKNGAPKIVYKDLQNYFGDRKPNLREVRRAVLEIRAAKSMVIDERDPNSRSAGSFFKNPIVSALKFSEIEQIARQMNFDNAPSFAAGAEKVKIPAAWLIEKSGFYKGFRRGGVGISNNHTLALVNFDGATAEGVLALKAEIQARVKEKFDIDLQPEPIFVGFKK